MIKVSVIIPVYNSEKHLQKCIESLLIQTLNECEFIFINDGSKDNSKEIIEEYKKKDARIQLINQENKGVSAARNAGLQLAKGEFIGFIDADDYISNDYYKTLVEAATNYNVVIVASNFSTEKDGEFVDQKSLFQTNKVFDTIQIQQEILPFFIKQDGLNSCCTKLFKKSLLLENNIIFPVGVSHGEDAAFALRAYSKATTVVFLNYLGYFYKEVTDSASRNILAKDFFQKALEVYASDYKKEYQLHLDNQTIQKLKAIRFISTVISLIHVYFKPNLEISYAKRYHFVKKMIDNLEVQNAIHNYWNDLIENNSKYNLFLLKSIKLKSMMGLVLATKYSNYRNKI